MNRTDRLYAIVEELRIAGPAGRTSTWLAERFGVSPRTIKRDVAALDAAGTPIWSEDGRAGGYRLQRAAALPPLTFTTGEATAIAIALAADPDLPFGSDGRAALAKIVGAMTPRGRDDAAALAARIHTRPPRPSRRAPWSEVLDEAFRAGVVVHLDYEGRDGARSERRPVEPLGFVRTGGRWFLAGWCRRSQEARWFRLEGIRAVTATRERFPPRDLEEVTGPPPPDARPVQLPGVSAPPPATARTTSVPPTPRPHLRRSRP